MSRRRWFRPYTPQDEPAPELPPQDGSRKATKKGAKAPGISGVYAIRDRRTKKVLYVGESHTGRLRKTLLRHFQRWRLPNDAYSAPAVEVCWQRARTLKGALKAQARWIAELRPRDNEIRQPEAEAGEVDVSFDFGANAK